jgi:hypothetical protein
MGTCAELLSGACSNQAEAEILGQARGCGRTLWIDS